MHHSRENLITKSDTRLNADLEEFNFADTGEAGTKLTKVLSCHYNPDRRLLQDILPISITFKVFRFRSILPSKLNLYSI